MQSLRAWEAPPRAGAESLSTGHRPHLSHCDESPATESPATSSACVGCASAVWPAGLATAFPSVRARLWLVKVQERILNVLKRTRPGPHGSSTHCPPPLLVPSLSSECLPTGVSLKINETRIVPRTKTTPPPLLGLEKAGIYIAAMAREERYVLNVGVCLCAVTTDRKFTARKADQRNSKVSASTDDRKVGVSIAKE